jgi:hypothetical protein
MQYCIGRAIPDVQHLSNFIHSNISLISNQCVSTIGVVLSVQHCWAPWWSIVRRTCSFRFKPLYQFINTSLTHTVHGTIFLKHSAVYIAVLFDPWNFTMAPCFTFVKWEVIIAESVAFCL